MDVEEGEEDADVEEEDVEEEDRSQETGSTLCASLRNRNAHGHCTRAIFYGNLKDKCRTPIPRHLFRCEPAQSKCTWTYHKRHFVQKFTRTMPCAYPATSVLCEPARSKCTWTYHRTHFVQKFTGKMPDASDTTSIEHRPLITRTRQCGHTVWGTKKRYQVRFCKLPLSRSR